MREERRARDGLEAAQLTRGGHAGEQKEREEDERGRGDEQRGGHRERDDHEHSEHLREVPEKVPQRHGQEQVDLVEVLREAVRDAPDRRTLEERQWRAQQTRCTFENEQIST